ncbi:heme-degrading monooxygenase HmoA [Sphingomonas sp. UYAg733]
MIVRRWAGKVPVAKAAGFHAHLIATGIGEYREHAGCADIMLWRRDDDGWAEFTLVSTWRDLDSVRDFAGADFARAVLYPGDEAFGLIPDFEVTHHNLLSIGA